MASLALASIALSAVGILVGMSGQRQQGEAANKQALYNARVARRNAVMAGYAAQDALDRGARDELTTRLQYKQIKGRQRAAFAANGVVVDEGSALDVVLDTVALGEFDALTVRSNAAKEAFNYREQADQFNSSAWMQTIAGKDAQRAGYIGAAGTLLSGASSVADKWHTYKQLDSNFKLF